MDRFDSSPVEARVYDLQDAFADRGVFATHHPLEATAAGYWGIRLRSDQCEPQDLCGFSDITALATAIYQDRPRQYGPRLPTTFGMKRGIDYT